MLQGDSPYTIMDQDSVTTKGVIGDSLNTRANHQGQDLSHSESLGTGSTREHHQGQCHNQNGSSGTVSKPESIIRGSVTTKMGCQGQSSSGTVSQLKGSSGSLNTRKDRWENG
jgi:hypothetical protein